MGRSRELITLTAEQEAEFRLVPRRCKSCWKLLALWDQSVTREGKGMHLFCDVHGRVMWKNSVIGDFPRMTKP